MVIRKSATAISLNNIYVPIRNDKTSQNAITFDVLHGNHFALLGLPKTGKSTIVKVLAGLVKVASGTGFVLDYALEDPHILNVPSIGFLHQEINWSGSLTVKDIFQLAARQYQQLDHHLMELVKIAGLQEKQHVPIKSLSVKERQLVGLVSLGIQDLDIMIMDDPADNLNGKDRTDVLDFLAYIARDKTLFFTTSHLDDVHHCATHVAILQDGVIIAQGEKDAILNYADASIYRVVLSGNTKIVYEHIKNLVWVKNLHEQTSRDQTTWTIAIDDRDNISTRLFRAILADTNLQILQFHQIRTRIDGFLKELDMIYVEN